MHVLHLAIPILGLLDVVVSQANPASVAKDVFGPPSIKPGKGPPGGIPGARRPAAAKKTNSAVFASSVISSLRSRKSREKAERTKTTKATPTTVHTTVKKAAKPMTTPSTKKKNGQAQKTTTPAKNQQKVASTTSAVPVTKAAQPSQKVERRGQGSHAVYNKKLDFHPEVENKKLEPRQNDKTCTQPELNLLNYIPSVNTPNGFILDAWMGNTAALNYIAPAGYYTTFYSQMAALFSKSQSLGYTQLASYDTAACAAICDSKDECVGFNIYFERNPLYVPNNTTCKNPTSRGSVACVPYGGMISADEAVNFGQWRDDFMVLITGSNGYIKTPLPASIQNFKDPKPLVGAINAYSSPNLLDYRVMGSYSTQDCANFCQETTAKNRAAAISSGQSTYRPCNYFNTFNLAKNAWNYRYTYCVLYTDSDNAQAGYINSAPVNNELLNVTYSHGWSLYPPDKGLTSKTWTAAPTGDDADCKSMATKYGSSLTTFNDRVYTFACAYDVQYAYDIGNTTSPDFYSCFELCDKFNGCSGFAYLGTTCYFKNLDGSSRTPQPNTIGADVAWLPSKYEGFQASKVPGTVTWGPTSTKVWSGDSVATTTSFSDITGIIVVQTPFTRTAGVTQYVTVTRESGTAQTPTTTTGRPNTNGLATVTVTYPTPILTCSNRYPRYMTWRNKFLGGQYELGYPSFDPAAYKGARPETTASATYLGVWNDDENTRVTQYSTGLFNTGTAVIAHQFYVFASRGTGYYHFNIPYGDDIVLIWFWDDAIKGWTRGNADMMVAWSMGFPARPLTHSFFLNAGTYVPVRIMWANGGGAGTFGFNVYGPDGSTMARTTDGQNAGWLSPSILLRPCDTTKGANWLAWNLDV
ncbi:GLEYA domain-containing protein 1 [Elsinoe fawcettii]|nr:GLEYA domain-containing protein 1 [Elsinoe fawcettii]